MDMSLSKLREMVTDGEAWHAAVPEVTKNWTWTAHEWQKMQWYILNWILDRNKDVSVKTAEIWAHSVV